MKRIILGLLDRLFVAFLAAAIVLAVLLVLKPWQPDVVSTVLAHQGDAIDCETLVLERWETPDGTQVLAPRLVPLWQYVQSGDRTNETRETDFRHAFESDLHAGDLTFHLTHEQIDGKEW